jgi:sugar/nucleoside kinase (ribokinase family)
VANTIAGIAGLGAPAGFVGKVSRDEFGEVFKHDLRTLGAEVSLSYADPAEVETGRCHVFVTEDAQRTMATYLGAANQLQPDDIDESIFARSDIAYLEGYLFDLPPAKEAMRKAIAATHGADGLVALSLSDSFCVERHRADFLDLVTGDVDILIANHLEAMSLFQVDSFDAVFRHLEELGMLAVITKGPEGSWVTTMNGPVHVDAPDVPDERVVDQNGAGDVFAAGFLFGLTDGADPVEAVRLGSVCAGEIITHMGPRALTDLRQVAVDAGLL